MTPPQQSLAQAKPSGLESTLRMLGEAAKAASAELALAAPERKVAALHAMAKAIRDQAGVILAANAEDMQAAEARNLSAALLDRLKLNDARVEGMAKGLEEIAAQPDPVGRTLAEWTRPNGLKISRVSVPLGVIGIIYESRPNVAADAGGLCLKSGNAAFLRGGSESAKSSAVIVAALQAGLKAAGLPEAAIQSVPTTDREAVGIMLRMDDCIDLIIPRGGRGLIERVAAESRIPVLKHLDGLCHTYVHAKADPAKAREIVLNAKMRRTGVCGATETLLIDKGALAFAEPIIADLVQAGCEVRGDDEALKLHDKVKMATNKDWDTEYLDAIIAVRVVDGIEEAMEHINRHGSHHTEAILTEDEKAAERFLREIDAGIVLVNASTQFADGGEFGMGAEIGISTGKLHARGPVGAEQLTSYKYLVRGNGQIRP
jgi:glutamate-5-semialdehyde dehydrogenase